ncbi:TPA: NAD-dependent epimerase/dehydratase family protein [Candidatus Poribacteria bacterium]|nr:NAD-dependent epimerase/dehydratase family protein [Candidatus Poribacteria bacterium]
MELHGKSILITGGCGFIGANLVCMLAYKNCKIKVLDNLSAGKRENLGQNDVELIVGDIRDEELIKKITQGTDVVVHLAAHTDVIKSIENPQLDFDVNVVGTFNLLKGAVSSQSVEKFIFASSNAAVGEQIPPITEKAIPAPLSPYGASKLTCEAYCSAFAASYGLQTVSLRFANAYGSYSTHKSSVISQFITNVLSNRPLTIYGNGYQTRDFIYVDDICRAILLSINNSNAEGIFQIGTGKETMILELAHKIKALSGNNVDIIFEPKRTGEIIRNYSGIEKATRILEFVPEIDIDTGLKMTYGWFCKDGYTDNLFQDNLQIC